jgi:hypothetical protein
VRSNLVQLLGFQKSRSSISIVSEHCARGDLAAWLVSYEATSDSDSEGDDDQGCVVDVDAQPCEPTPDRGDTTALSVQPAAVLPSPAAGIDGNVQLVAALLSAPSVSSERRRGAVQAAAAAAMRALSAAERRLRAARTLLASALPAASGMAPHPSQPLPRLPLYLGGGPMTGSNVEWALQHMHTAPSTATAATLTTAPTPLLLLPSAAVLSTSMLSATAAARVALPAPPPNTCAEPKWSNALAAWLMPKLAARPAAWSGSLYGCATDECTLGGEEKGGVRGLAGDARWSSYLAARPAPGPQLSEVELAHVMLHVLRGLEVMHSAGLTHGVSGAV